MTKNKEKSYYQSSNISTKYEKPCDQMLATFQFFCDSDWIRTNDPQLRSVTVVIFIFLNAYPERLLFFKYVG